MLISPTEPARIKQLGEVSSAPEKHGCDILITVGNALTGIQRKEFPGDFTASLGDGRLMEQLGAMSALARRLLVLEGYGQWTNEGELIGYRRFTKHQMFGLIYSISFEFGVQVLRVRDMTETIDVLEELEVWAAKEKHISLLQRPGPKKDGWGHDRPEARAIHILQGFPGVGPGLAANIVEHFGGVPLAWQVENAKALEAVPGIGKGKAKQLWDTLNEIRTKDS